MNQFLIALILALGLSTYWFYSQNQILTLNNAKLEGAIAEQEAAIESLQNDFTKMIKMYHKNIDTILPHSNKSKFTQKKFTMNDLYKETIVMINKKYKRDFETFDYNMIIV